MPLLARNVPLPRAWCEHTRAATLQAVALAHFVATHVRGWCVDSRIARVRLVAERDIALSKVAALEEEARLLRTRLEHVAAPRRPHYPPTSRLAILVLRAARGWTLAETARRFLISEQTVTNWMHRLDEEGVAALVRMPEPVSRFPDFVRHIVGALGRTFPTFGKVRLAQLLARAGLHLAATTVARLRKTRPRHTPPTRPAVSSVTAHNAATRRRAGRTVTARYPHHVWNVDLTLLPIVSGLWVPWIPQALLQRWPFSFWLAAVLDHHSRAVVGAKLFRSQPSAHAVTRLLDTARRSSGVTPKYIVSDQGAQFQDHYRRWCRRRGVRPRFGAIGKHGSIAVLERFFRSLKDEMLRRLPIVPMALPRMGREVDAYVLWYNEHRPHQGLAGRTPAEVRDREKPAASKTGWETRLRYPLARGDPSRASRGKRRRVKGHLVLELQRVDSRSHLPIVQLRHVA